VKQLDLRNAHKKLVTGAGVKPMQRLLGVTADGKAGAKTQAALKAAQKRLKLDVDAIFGPATATALLGENR
jgi:peptidoglycan hydrolase-like protein with peptidoglycan-binding domain